MVNFFSRRGLHGSVVDHLGRQILQGDLPAGASIDQEQLETDLEVSRTVVREAIKVLTAKGLVDARPRLGTYVRGRENWNLLDSEVMSWRGVDRQLLIDVDEVRLMVEPFAARLAADRRSAEDLEAIKGALEQMQSGQNDAETTSADIDFHRGILKAAGNELMQRLEVVLVPALRARDTFTLPHTHGTDFVDLHTVVFNAIKAGDAAAAASSMTQLVEDAAAFARDLLNVAVGAETTT